MVTRRTQSSGTLPLSVKLIACTCVAIVLALASVACDPAEQWGSPEYFERLVGVRFVPTQPVMRCQDEVGFDFTAFRRVGLPQSAVETLRNGPKKLATLPRQFPYERDRRLQKWSQSPLSIEAREALEFAMVGAVAAVEHAGCHNIDSDRIRSAVSDSLRKPTTFYMFQYKRVGDQVLPEALDFRILDLADGILFELVNFS